MRTLNRINRTLGILLAGYGLFACSTRDGFVDDQAQLGELGLRLTVGGLAVSSVELTISSEAASVPVTRHRSFDISDPNASITATERGLPPGTYRVSLSAEPVDDPATAVDESELPCVGVKAGVVVQPGAVSKIEELVLLCTVDGGMVQNAGGISVEVDVQTDVTNDCPDLIEAAFVGPLETSAGASVQLVAEHAEDVGVVWSASAGAISVDGTVYTCPPTPGVYTLQATFTRDGECQQVFSEQVTCHGDHNGRAEDLPTSFAFSGSCNLAGPCQLEQDGKAWTAVCGSRPDRFSRLSGEAVAENQFPFLASGGRVCTGQVVEGEFVGSCTDAAGASCDFATDSSPSQTLACPLVGELSELHTCSGTYENCTVAQQGCNILAKCGDHYIGRNINADGSIRIEEYVDAKLIRCEAPVVGNSASGICAEVGSANANPTTCSFSVQVVEAESACEETLTAGAFVLGGCGFDDVCIARQQGCVWEVACSKGIYTGTASSTDSFDFEGPGGAPCRGSAVNGEFVGTCGTGGSTCSFGPVAPETDPSCMTVPDSVSARGCGFGSHTGFEVVQDGCRFLGYAPSRGVYVFGDVTATGLSFPGFSPGWVCSAEQSAEFGDELWGNCVRENTDGTTSQCRDLTGDQGSRLVIQL